MRWFTAIVVLSVMRLAIGAGADVRGVLDEADALFAQGAGALSEDAARGEALLMRSAGLMERAAEEGGIRNGRLEYNTGNAYLLAGDVGRAILHFKRGALLAKHDERIRTNLAAARARVVDRVGSSGRRQVARTVFFWHYDIPTRLRAIGLIGAWAMVWIGGAWVLLRGWGASRGWVIGVGVIGAAALGTSLVVEDRELEARREAVIVVDSVVARTGPDERAYGARFERPLHAGVEVRVEEERAGWVYVRLTDGREAWVPTAAIERV